MSLISFQCYNEEKFVSKQATMTHSMFGPTFDLKCLHNNFNLKNQNHCKTIYNPPNSYIFLHRNKTHRLVKLYFSISRLHNLVSVRLCRLYQNRMFHILQEADAELIVSRFRPTQVKLLYSSSELQQTNHHGVTMHGLQCGRNPCTVSGISLSLSLSDPLSKKVLTQSTELLNPLQVS